jgi:flagellar biosynthetic protein FliP
VIRLALILAALLLPVAAAAQDLTIPLQGDGTFSSRVIQLIAIVTLLSIAPGLAVMVTCFPFIVTVLSILRQAIGLQAAPPNLLIVSLALFLTWFVMDPVLTAAWEAGLRPLLDGTVPPEVALADAAVPFRGFMTARVDEGTLLAFAALRPGGAIPVGGEAPLSVLVPAFMLSEISRAFEIGFLIFLPFLIIDLVVAAVLMSMGMMMVPPAVVALPFKLAFFVVADGWRLVAEALVRSYA